MKSYNVTYKCIYDIHDKLKILNDEDNGNIFQATKLQRTLLKKEKDDHESLPTTAIRIKYHLSYDKVNVGNESLMSFKSNKYSELKKYMERMSI